MNKNTIQYKLIIFLLFFSYVLYAQESTMASPDNHPRIYGNKNAQQNLVKNAEQLEWKKAIVQQKKENIDKYVELCSNEPDWLLSRLQMNWLTKHDKVFLKGGNFSHSEGEAPVPTVRFSGTRDWASNYRFPSLEDLEPYFDDERGMYVKSKETGEMEWVHPSKVGHGIEGINRKIMALAEDAAFLYWLTGDKKYAEFAAPVYDTYIQGMFYREAPVDLNNSNQQRISGLATFEVIHEQIVVSLTLIYDFMFDYLKANGHDMAMSAAVFQKWGDQIIKNGVPDNNWNFFQARFLTYIALALDDNNYYENGKGQQYYLDHTFTTSTDRQIALKEAVGNYDYKTAMWPECASYSMHVTETLLKILTLLDNATNADEFKNFPVVEKATLSSFQYLFPDGDIVAFGDSRHQSLPSESFEYLIANYRKYNKYDKEKKITALYKSLSEDELKHRGRGLFELFFYVDNLVETEEKTKEELITSLTSPTFYAPNVSWFMQRMGSGDNATVVSTFGAMGNHAHANGVAIEMYADNQVIAPDMSKGPSYWHEDHRNYYSRYPAHNTVVVDGISDSEAMRVRHPFTMEFHFPESGDKDNIFKQVTFSDVSFVEPATLAKQNRLTALINGKSGKPYVLDIFRSERPGAENQKHEYFYHNLGQSLKLFDENTAPLSLNVSNHLNTEGNIKAYNYFTDETSVASSENLSAQFKLESAKNPIKNMKLWIKGDQNRTYFSVNGPQSHALNKATVSAEIREAKVPALVIRKDGEAWIKPFVVVYNPYVDGGEKVVAKVAYPEIAENNAAQFINVTHSDGITVDSIVATTSENDVVNLDGFYQKGLLSIKRVSEDDKPDFIFTSGITRYAAAGWEICTFGEPVTTSIESCDKGFQIQNDKPVLIGMPKNLNPDYVEIYENGKLVEKRKGNLNRNNPNRIDFKFEKPFEKAVIVLKK
ncbi:heparinase II/III family protein [Draconibacterium sp.]|uniref:heparinase II/III domain-containing protein n=1 Tax=Draconibacterium sp. TaxID=1965318 RepID=UPI0035623271